MVLGRGAELQSSAPSIPNSFGGWREREDEIRSAETRPAAELQGGSALGDGSKVRSLSPWHPRGGALSRSSDPAPFCAVLSFSFLRLSKNQIVKRIHGSFRTYAFLD